MSEGGTDGGEEGVELREIRNEMLNFERRDENEEESAFIAGSRA